MNTGGPIPFPGPFDPAGEELERALIEIDTAIELVATRAAVRISLTGFRITDAVGGAGAARAREASVGFRIERGETASARSIIVGPLVAGSSVRHRP